MALLDILRNLRDKAGQNLERNVGGLLGEDISKLSPEERSAVRRQAAMAVFDAMARNTTPTMGLRQVAADLGGRLQARAERQAAEQQMQTARSTSSQIAGRLLGGAPAPTAHGPMGGDGLTGVNVQSQYRRDPMDALRLGMSPAGADAMRINPLLQAPLQQMLAPAEAPKETDDMREYRVAISQGYRGSFMDYMRDVKGLSAPRTVVNLPPAEGKFQEAGGKRAFESRDEAYQAATSAADNLGKIYDTIEVIRSGQPFTGILAETQRDISRVMQKVSGRPDQRITDTEVLDALLGSEVFPLIKQLGIGARGLDTPAEKEFLREVMTGKISLDKTTLERMTQIRANVAEKIIDRFNERVERGELDSYFEVMGMPKRKIEKPEKPAALTGPREGQVAVNPQTGQRIVFRNGRWVAQ